MDDIKFTIEHKDSEQSPWLVTFAYGTLSHSMVMSGSHIQATHLAEFAIEGAKAAVARAAQQAFHDHLEHRFADWVRAQWLREN